MEKIYINYYLYNMNSFSLLILTVYCQLSLLFFGQCYAVPLASKDDNSAPKKYQYWEVEAHPGVDFNASLTLGEPGQKMTSIPIDTGSSDTWFADNYFDTNSSSSNQYVNSDFVNSYIDGSSSTGYFVRDKVLIDDTKFSLQFGVGKANESRREGIIGLSFPEYEQGVIVQGKEPYPNFIRAMKNQGIIERTAFSMYPTDGMAHPDMSKQYTHSILFGGIDKSKFEGELHPLPIVYNTWYTKSDKPFTYYLQLDEISIGNESISGPIDNNETSNAGDLLMRNSTIALLDSGCQGLLLPQELLDQFVTYMEPSKDDEGRNIIPCDSPKAQGYMNFKFHGGYTSSIKMSNYVIPNSDDPSKCTFYVFSAANVINLGAPFFANNYLHFDQEAYEISIGKLKDSTVSEQDIEPVRPFTKGINPTTVTLDPVANPTFPYASKATSSTCSKK